LSSGGSIDRTTPIWFTFDGRALVGHPGDTLAAALLANHIRVLGRSLKFHRPRGVFSCGMEEPNALLQLSEGARTVPSARATLTPLYDGLRAKSQSGWPNVRFDVLRIFDRVAPLFAAGFYNKTFMWPSWHWYEPMIRRLAGLGRAPVLPDPDRYEVRNAHCDVLVVGGGAAGLAAALAAARSNLDVWLVEQQSELGGWARWASGRIEGVSAQEWIRSTIRSLGTLDNVRIHTGTVAVGVYDHGVVALNETCEDGQGVRERFCVLRTKKIVLAAGAIEQPLIFDNNDRPGIMLAGAAHQYVKRFAVAPGRVLVIATNNDSAYPVARDLVASGIRVACITDARARVAHPLAEDLRREGVPVHEGSLPLNTEGFRVLSGVTLGHVSDDAQSIVSTWSVACDALLVSGGWNPNLALYTQAGGKLQFDLDRRILVPSLPLASVSLAGEAAGIDDMELAVKHARALGNEGPAFSSNASEFCGPRVRPGGDPRRQWVDLLHDVTVSDLDLAIAENYRSIEHVKRYTTIGMSADQGKTSAVAAIELVAARRAMSPADLGHTTFRPPVLPVTLGAIASGLHGKLFASWRETPLHAWHVAHGAVLETYGGWQRPACYLQTGESREDAIRREVVAVRHDAGLFDASSLGKIEIHGPDAREFLDRFYINRLDSLKPGQVRYAIMLRENGVVLDDGTVVALSPQQMLITTTSGNATRVAHWLEEWRQCEWPSMRVVIVPVTDRWATLSLSGPKARDILRRLEPNCDLTREVFPHLSMRQARLQGVEARIYRVSFTGELTYEINVPSSAALSIWQELLNHGGAYGIQPYGVEALQRLRLEKGYIHIGTDTDGTTVPEDIGWGHVTRAKLRDFIGKRSLALPESVRADRLQLVGLRSSGALLVAGSHIRISDTRRTTDGWVTSAGRLSSDGTPIGLALIRGGRSLLQQEVSIYDAGRQVGVATVVAPPFYDAPGDRLHA